jgi:hypothetical protein
MRNWGIAEVAAMWEGDGDMTLAYGEKLCTPVWSLSTARSAAIDIAT